MSLDYATLDPQLELTAVQIGKSREQVQPTPPEVLFHYTNSAGMRGILESSSLWATNYRFLNDRSEVAYGVSLFESVVKDRLANIGSDVVAEFLGRTLSTANPFDGMFDCYVACFCERDDLLNQWRVYAGTGGGYALGFKTHEIGLRWGDLHASQDFVLRKVIYSEDLQRKLIAEVVDSTVSALESATGSASVSDANLLIARCCQFVRAQIADYLICFKHQAFEVEEEWRLCHVPSTHEEKHVLFRDGIYGLTPYVRIDPSPMVGVNANKLPLATITHGPVPDPLNARFALEKLLRAKAYFSVEVSGSALPVRIGS